MIADVRVDRAWCEGNRHPQIATVPRGGAMENMNETIQLHMDQPQVCLIVNGTPLCVVYWETYGQELSIAFVEDMEDLWLSRDTYDAIQTASALTEKKP